MTLVSGRRQGFSLLDFLLTVSLISLITLMGWARLGTSFKNQEKNFHERLQDAENNEEKIQDIKRGRLFSIQK